MTAPDGLENVVDWKGIADEYGQLEYGIVDLIELVQNLREQPAFANSEQLQTDLGEAGLLGHIEQLAVVAGRLDARLANAFDHYGPKVPKPDGHGFLGWREVGEQLLSG